jgi:predicted transcriptional regulator
LNAVADTALPLLRARTDFAAWLVLFRHAKPDGTATASVADLARRAGCCESAMRRALKRLRVAGLVERLKRGTLAGGPSVWRLLTPEGDRP